MCSRPERKRRWRRRHIPWADVEVTIDGELFRGVARTMPTKRQLVCEMRLDNMRHIDRVITEVGFV